MRQLKNIYNFILMLRQDRKTIYFYLQGFKWNYKKKVTGNPEYFSNRSKRCYIDSVYKKW